MTRGRPGECPHGNGAKKKCVRCRRDYHREYARNVRRAICPKCGYQLTDTGAGRDGRRTRRCFVCRPIRTSTPPPPPAPPVTHCPRCGVERTPETYRTYGGGARRCVPCQKAMNREWRLHNPDKMREINRKAFRKYYAKRRALQGVAMIRAYESRRPYMGNGPSLNPPEPEDVACGHCGKVVDPSEAQRFRPCCSQLLCWWCWHLCAAPTCLDSDCYQCLVAVREDVS